MREVAILSLFLIALACPALCKLSRSKHVPPVVLIPGDGGSQMEAKLNKSQTIHYICSKMTDWFDLWLNMELLVPYVIDCWVDNMKLVYDNVTRTTSNSEGVETRIPGFGNSTTVEWLDPSQRSPTGYFKDIVNALVSLGYERGVTVRGAPFDFRKAPNEHSEYFLKLRRLIEETYQYSGHKVMLILHSMGAPMIRYFLKHQPQHWKNKHIETVVSLAGAWGGSVKAVKVFTAGDNLGIYVISAVKVRDEQRSAPSLAFLLPSPELWGPDDHFIETDTMNVSTANLKDMFDALDLPDAYEMYLDTKDLINNAPAPGVEVHCLHGVGVDTVEKLVYTKKGSFPDSPNLVYGDGDGTVNVRSAELCLKWKDGQKQNVYHKALKGIDHMQILSAKESINYIVELVSNITDKNIAKAERKIKRLTRLEKKKEWAKILKSNSHPSSNVLPEYKDFSFNSIYDLVKLQKKKEEDRRKNDYEGTCYLQRTL
ncbi:lysosomal phospholipase A and acyltransferase-like [Palaemon carinicauda]|uniref:lysosomal phospholipase A and acyltransferase-like n=1 Tax=Palaemon carinicauda TaxID=392227 RepID=UPI0035B5AAD6